MGYLIVITIVLGMFLIYRFSDRIEKNMPWLWKNVAQPIFNYFFVISVRKVTIAYFTTMAGICVAFPAIQFVIDKEHNIEAAITFRRIGQKKCPRTSVRGHLFCLYSPSFTNLRKLQADLRLPCTSLRTSCSCLIFGLSCRESVLARRPLSF